jgi:putative oxidoreductase
MNVISRIERWGDSHHPAVIDVLRIVLGAFLFLKGFMFMQNMAYLKWMLDTQILVKLSTVLITVLMCYTVLVHMAGGLLVMLGLATRVSALVQLPIIAGALFMVDNFRSPLNADFWLTLITGILLVLFAVVGSGPLSLNNFLSKINEP